MESLEIINGTHAKIGSFGKKYTEGWNYKIKWEVTSLLKLVSAIF